MLVQSFLVQGSGRSLSSQVASWQNHHSPVDALVIFSLGADHSRLQEAAAQVVDCPCYITETYGIIGYDETVGENIELMEKGRGSEYGYVGGSGGRGCLVAGFSGGAVSGHDDDTFPETASNLMVIADQTKAWAKVVQR